MCPARYIGLRHDSEVFLGWRLAIGGLQSWIHKVRYAKGGYEGTVIAMHLEEKKLISRTKVRLKE